MRSDLPKPLFPLCGRPMVVHCIEALSRLQPSQTVIVVGHQATAVTNAVSATAPGWANIEFAEQITQNGTGDAASVGVASLHGDDYDDAEESTVVIIPGDAPLLRADTLDELLADHVSHARAATLLTSRLEDPTGYGRVVRDKHGQVLAIVEQRDANPEQLAIDEVNTSIYAFRRDLLGPALRNLKSDNAQGELYLTDVVGALAGMGHHVGAIEAPASETQGVNDRWQLALAERELRNRINRHWLLNGVTMFDPRQTFIDIDVKIGHDVTLYPSTMLLGSTEVKSGSQIGPHTQLTDCRVGARTRIRQTVADRATVGDDAEVGPFVYLGPGVAIGDGQVVRQSPTQETAP